MLRDQAILLRNKGDRSGPPRWQDSTHDVDFVAPSTDGRSVEVTFVGRSGAKRKKYSYSSANVDLLPRVHTEDLGARRVYLRGHRVNGVATCRVYGAIADPIVHFHAEDGSRIGDTKDVVHQSEVALREDPGATDSGRALLDYWATLLRELPLEGALRSTFDGLRDIHPDSVLARYVSPGSDSSPSPAEAAPPSDQEPPPPSIFPFHGNRSQRTAIENALNAPVSVIEGPPGTGKTQTILNLIATILDQDLGRVAVVSQSNAAVDNVDQKLRELELDFIAARLGNRSARDAFFTAETQQVRARRRADYLQSSPGVVCDRDRLRAIGTALAQAQDAELDLRVALSERAEAALEQQHFSAHLGEESLPDLRSLPLLRKGSPRILELLAETAISPPPRWYGRFRRYLRYGRLRNVDLEDMTTILGLQSAFYERRLSELDQRIAQLRVIVQDGKSTVAEVTDLSRHALRESLYRRYEARDCPTFRPSALTTGAVEPFAREFPVLLSTCHSLARCHPPGELFEYLIVDEASQVDVLLGALVMGQCKNLIVVGDRRQTQPILSEVTAAAPGPTYDYRHHSLLSTVLETFGEATPRVLLREHYRSDPMIIGYCNRAFYDGQLVPFTDPGPTQPALRVHHLPPGNHTRLIENRLRNQREIDALLEEILPELAHRSEEVGVVAPFRLQVDTARTAVQGSSGSETVEVDTVHSFQGREKPIMVFLTVLDESKRSGVRRSFADDPHLINVAVSRARDELVVIVDHGGQARTRRLRDLVRYIRHSYPDQAPSHSSLISIFDLLYREYDRSLEKLSARLVDESRYRSENIAATVLDDCLASDEFAFLQRRSQVYLRNLLPPSLDRGILTPEEKAFAYRTTSSVDFTLASRVSHTVLAAVEVDGVAYHSPTDQQRRDGLKNSVLAKAKIPLLRLPTDGHGEPGKILEFLRSIVDG